MYIENKPKSELILLNAGDDLVHRNDDVMHETEFKSLKANAKLYFRPRSCTDPMFVHLVSDYYEDKLLVDVNGNVYRHPYDRRRQCYIMDQWVLVTPKISERGYGYFSWHHNTLYVHKLVAMAWCELTGEDPDGKKWTSETKLEVDHIDKNKLNNHPSNLRWTSK